MSALRIAIVDSGINAVHSHVGSVLDGVAIHMDEGGQLLWHEDWRDRLGHGTAVAGAVRLFAPEAELLAVNVFDRTGRATVEQLVAAIDWAIAHGAQIINLSLGTANPEHAGELEAAARRAEEAACILVAAAPSHGATLWPACLPSVVGVRADMSLGPVAIGYMPGDLSPWRAYGRPRPLPGAAETRNFQGSSFAAARISGILARAAGASQGFKPERMRRWLSENARLLPVGVTGQKTD